MRAINVLLAALVSLVIFLGLFEGGLRLIGKGPQESPLQFDAQVGWVKKPDYRGKKRQGDVSASFEHNRFGLRDDDVESSDKPAGVFRILALGDSFTYGYAVERADLFVDLLENDLRAAGRSVEVVNAGTEAWDTAQQAAWLEAHGDTWQPDLVLLLPYENDLYWNSQTEYWTPDGARSKPSYDGKGRRVGGPLEDNSGKHWSKGFALTSWMAPKHLDEREPHLFEVDGQRLEKELAPLLDERPAFQDEIEVATRGALLSIAGSCERLGAKLLVAPIPSATGYHEDWKQRYEQLRGLESLAWSPQAGVEQFLDLANDLGLPTVDARPALDAAASEKPDERLYWSTDWHFNDRGNRVFAGVLADELTQSPYGLPPTGAALASLSEASDPKGGLPSWAFLYLGLLVALSGLYIATYRDEAAWLAPLKIGALLAVIFATFMGISALAEALPPGIGSYLPLVFVVGILGFVAFKLGSRLGTITELIRAFILRGHWYLMPLVVVLLTIGSLLVVAASSPLVAPFIYTLF
jgi:hypothetical protein